jgi:hypothetical protein
VPATDTIIILGASIVIEVVFMAMETTIVIATMIIALKKVPC